MKDNWIRKIPWGILAGSFAILLFFCLVGTIAAFIVLDMMAGETSMHATLFDEWYQVVLFRGCHRRSRLYWQHGNVHSA